MSFPRSTYERPSLFSIDALANCGSSGAGVEADQNESGKMPKWEAACIYALALCGPSMNGLDFARAPASAKQVCGFFAGEPTITWPAFLGQYNSDNASVIAKQ